MRKCLVWAKSDFWYDGDRILLEEPIGEIRKVRFEGEREELVFISELFIERLRELKSKDPNYNVNDSFHSVLSEPELFRMRKIEMICDGI